MKYIKMKSLLAFLLCMAIIASLLTVNISAKENISYTEDELSGEQSKEECITIDDSADADRYGLGDVIVFGDPAEDSSEDQSEEESYIINEDNDEVSDSEISADTSVSSEESEAEAGNESTTPDATDTANGKKPIDKNEKPQYNGNNTNTTEEETDTPAENVNNNVVDKDYSTRLSGSITYNGYEYCTGGTVENGETYNITFNSVAWMNGTYHVKGTLNITATTGGPDGLYGFFRKDKNKDGDTVTYNEPMFVIYEGGTLNVDYDVSGADGKLYLDGGSNGFKYGNTEVNASEPVTVNDPLILMYGGTCNLGKNVRIRFNENVSTTNHGGGINMEGGTLTMKGAVIEWCDNPGGYGGGIYATGGVINVEHENINTWIGPCTAKDGGGVYLGKDDEKNTKAKMTIDSSSFTLGASSTEPYDGKEDGTKNGDWSYYRNVASQNGGGVYVDGGELIIESMYAGSWNEAQNGGAIYVNEGTATVKLTDNDKLLYKNTAEKGGTFYVANGGELEFVSGKIQKSGLSERPKYGTTTKLEKPTQGAAIYIEDGGVATLSGGSIVDCEGKLKGGAIYIENGGILNLSGDCTINNNKVAEKIDPVPENIAPNGTYKGVNCRAIKSSDASYITDTLYGDSGFASYHSGKMNNGNTACGRSDGTGFILTSGDAAYIVFELKEKAVIKDVQVYMDTNSLFGCKYPTSINVYVSNSESTSNLSNPLKGGTYTEADSTSNGVYDTRAYPFTGENHEGLYVIVAFVPATGKWLSCGEVVINGYYTSEVQTETTYGGGIYNAGTVNMSGGTISSNSAVEGGGVFNLGDFTMSGGTISSNTAANGGGIGAYGGTVNISGGTIENNTATEDGGGIYFRNFTANTERNLTISGGTITGNEAGDDGGGVCARSNNETAVINFNYSGGTISQNQCTTGGGGGIILYGSGIKFNMSQADDNNPTVVSGNTNTANHGGGIWVGSVTSFKMSGGTVTGNYLNANINKAGAGIFFNRAIKETVEITGGTISSNYYARYGGGICLGDETTNLDDEGSQFASLNVEITDCDIHSNSAEQGGGIYAERNGTHYANGITLTVGDGVTIRNNSASCNGNGGGAGITARGVTVTLGAEETDGPSLTGNGGNQGNQSDAAWDGAAIYCNGSTVNFYSGEISGNIGCHSAVYLVDSTLTMSGGKISNNSDGGVFLNGTGAKFILTDGEISGNTLGETGKVQGQQNYGGAGVCCYNGGVLQMSGGKITGNVNYNTAVDNAGEDFDSKHHGGGIAVIKRTVSSSITNLVITGGEISGNISTNGAGGGIFIEEGGSLTISEGVAISGNTAQNGAGIYSRSEGTYISTITINGGTISGNEAVTSGGGMYVNGNVNLTVNGGTFTDNKAPGYGGGAICINSFKGENNTDSKIIGNTIINGNNTALLGGGIAVFGSTGVEISGTGVLVSGNVATSRGGGIYLENSLSVIIKDVTISKNEAEYTGTVDPDTYGGGGIYMKESSNVSIDGVTVSENTSTRNAGGIFIYNNNASNGNVINNVTFEDNTANRFGGGMYIHDQACNKLTITECKFDGCKSLLDDKKWYYQDPNLGGGGICIDDGSTFTTLDLSNNAFTDCTAETAGGGIAMKCVASSAEYQTKIITLKLDGCTFDGCKTVSQNFAGYGGALCLISRFGTISYNGGSIKNCEATNGSAIFLGTLWEKETAYDFVVAKAFNITNVTFEGNKNECNETQISNNETEPINGGAITTTKASAVMTLTGCTFKDNVNNNGANSNGGAISWRAGSTSTATNFEVSATKLIIDGCTFQGNTAANGGAVYTSIPTGAVTVTLKGSTQVGVENGGNVATEYGGGLYVHHSGVTLDVEDCTVCHNEAKYGGGLYVSSAAVANLKNGTVSFNDASSHGGGIHASNATVNISGTDITENTASKGGGISAISGADVTMSGGWIRSNKAVGTPDSLKTSYHEHQYLKGVGGGVYIVDGESASNKTVFTLTTANPCGLYENLADFAADDVFANGVNTRLVLPRASSMTINHETYKVAEGWYEDYNTGDTNYALGLAGNTILGGQRCRYVKDLYPIRAYVDQTENELNASVLRYINTDDTYVCLTLAISDSGVDKLTITTIVGNDVASSDQLFAYVVSGITNTGEAVSFSVSMLGNSSETIFSLPEGTYSVTAYTDWSWRYKNSAVYANGSLQQDVSVGSFIISKNGVSPVVVFISDLEYLYWLNGNSKVEKNKSQAGIYLSEYGTHFSDSNGKLENATATLNSFNFTLTGTTNFEYVYFPIKGLTPGKTYRIDFSETFNGEYLNSYPYGCGAFTTHPTSHYFWENQIDANTIPQLDLTNADKRAWYTDQKGKQSGYIEFTADSSIMYWTWCFGDIKDNTPYPMSFEGVSLSVVN
ncbi:MAG: right-handed parallel beta-helix repeat-containing protein [Clostridia bacterium]|nr:right-handed parallel beta-helix repeat-containing protein [Clostridia bacterium]